MSELIRVPDIGSGEGEVIELFVKVGDKVEADQSILTLESDKASMEIPAPKAGVVKSLKVKLGDRLKEGDELLELEIEGAADAAPAPAAPAAAPAPAAEKPAAAAQAPAAPAAAPAAATVQDIHVPDIGSSGKAKIIELLVKVGDTVNLTVDVERRDRIRANHSATHLLHAALRKELGGHVTQKGSMVAADRLRFDFSHPEALTQAQIAKVEADVNAQIRHNDEVMTR
ncbi:biotin/lipoyl-containing protein, partial [Pseudomonas sp. BC115LW]|uniref:biotin/lipoyl-containing protein n=1 Tax=Pseudomonas sp. BC115LW TaxID=2683267 RepID=UPI0035322CAC